jgi:5-methylcytosine-specific restriction endonuclease McrA
MLNAEVLILNRVYLPIRVTTAWRAVCLLYQGKARAILPDYRTYDFRSWLAQDVVPGMESLGLRHGRLRLPRVIVLEHYAGVPRHDVRFSRRNVFVRDGHRCQYCGEVRAARDLNLDHVTPISQGGSSTWENVVCCCITCNRRKGNRSPEAAGMRLLRVPKRPRWHPLHDAGRRAGYPEDWRHFVDPAILEWVPDRLPAASRAAR